MKIGIVLISRNPVDAFNFAASTEFATHASFTLHVGALFNSPTKHALYENDVCAFKKALEVNGVTSSCDWRALPTPKDHNDLPLIALRARAAELCGDVDLYYILDDNNEFRPDQGNVFTKSSALKIADCVAFFKQNPNCVAIQTRNHFGGHGKGHEIIRTRNGILSTGTGILLRRRAWAPIFPPDAIDLLGAMEEILCVYDLINDTGGWVARQYNNPTAHHNLRHRSNSGRGAWDTTNDAPVARYIRSRFDSNWSFIRKQFPHKFLRHWAAPGDLPICD